MAIYRHNGTGKYVIVLDSNLRGETLEPNRGDDFVLPLLEEIAEKVSQESRNVGNEFPIAQGYSVSPIGGGQNAISNIPENQPTFLKELNSDAAKSNFENMSNSGQLQPFRIKKGKFSVRPEDQSWTETLNDIEINKTEAKLVVAVNKTLSENNLNSPDSPFFVSQEMNENDIVLGTVQNKTLGVHGPRKFPDVVQSDPAIDRLSIKDMKQVGLRMLMAASGESEMAVNFGDNLGSVEAANLLPSLTELGSKVSFGSIKAAKIMEGIKPGFKKFDNDDSLIDNNYMIDSWGSPNNPMKPFQGTGSPVSVAKTFATLITISFMLKKIAIAYNMTGRNLGDHLANGSSRDRQKLMGSSTANAGQESIAQALDPFDIPPISNDFFLSMDAGFRQFFGIGDSLTSAISGTAAFSSSKSFGYYSIFVRRLNQAIQELVLGKIATVINNENASTGSNIRTDVLSPEALMESLKSNFVIKFIKVLALIGDKALTVSQMQQQVEVPGIEGYVSDIDGTLEKISSADTSLNPTILVVKHRLDSKDGMTAYGTSTHKSMYLYPRSVIEADLALNREAAPLEKAAGQLSEANKVFTNDYVNGRIPKEEVKKMEDYLERDYMPFYFHDLRTNEIISFHAFLDSASDSIQAEYNEVEGYGRIGTVPIYKNTKRSINFSFKVLAVNDKDHDEMWYKLNRLAACLHPQYSEGRLLEHGGNKFIQPFSQVFAASPLIRIRLGDLWKTNYSKLAVARLFGLSGEIEGQETTFKLATTRQVSVTPSRTRIRQEQQQRNNQALQQRPLQVGDRVFIAPTSNKNRWPVVVLADASNTNSRLLGQRIGEYRTLVNNFLEVRTGRIEGEIVAFHPSTAGTGNNYLVRVISRFDASDGLTTATQVGFLKVFNNVRGRGIVPTTLDSNPEGAIVCVNPALLIRKPPTLESVEQPDPIVQEQQISSTVSDFFKCDGDNPNPIMKAFCSTEGKGLACVIKSMALDGLIEANWVVDKFDGRTPMLVTINMEITPIYDVYPGLDSKGMMTAPVWPSGKTVNNSMGHIYSSEDGYKNFANGKSSLNFPAINKVRT